MIYRCIIIVSLFFLLNRGKCYETSNLKFPEPFLFGAGTSAYQIEGAWNESGKGEGVWDHITHNRNELIVDGTNGDIASDSYHKYKDDIALLKELKVNFYRFSISWPRILPTGFIDKINWAGVNYYNNLIDGLLEAGIEPWVTIYHNDHPQSITLLGAWGNPAIVNWITDYANVLFSLFGDRVKTWLTINQPNVMCAFMPLFDLTEFSGGEPPGIGEYKCLHNVIRAHAKIYRLYQRKYKVFQGGRIALTLDSTYFEPASNSTADIEAAQRRLLFEFGLSAHPLVYGNYPQLVIDIVANNSAIQGYSESRLPKFSFLERLEVHGAYDFFSINHYRSAIATDARSPPTNVSFENDIGVNTTELEVYPEGFRKLLVYIKENYKNPEIAITEQGSSDDPDTFNDTGRIDYYSLYLTALLKAVHEDGVNVKAYGAWSLIDNFEWIFGYTVRYGIYHVDFDSPNRTRTPKQSASFYKNVIETRSLVDTY